MALENLPINSLKISKASDLTGKDRVLYRALEMLPGVLAIGLLLILFVLSYFKPLWVAYFIIVFDIYWLLLVLYLGIHLFASYFKMRKGEKTDWAKKCADLDAGRVDGLPDDCLAKKGWKVGDIIHVIVDPTAVEPVEVLRPSFQSVVENGFPTKQIIFVLALEEREGERAVIKGRQMEKEFSHYFRNFLAPVHPDGMVGELKGKGANQAYAAEVLKREIIDKEGLDYDKILVSVIDSDTVFYPGYFHCLTYKFLTVSKPYQASYQPVPLYHNNIWSVPFFSRVAAMSNTFWQMMQQIRVEKLATYSSHSMTWRALTDIGFWSKNMVSEDSRIFWHCYLHYNGDYRVEPLHFPVSMDSLQVTSLWKTVVGLYKQQRRWGWGVENLPYLVFNVIKSWKKIKKRDAVGRIFVQVHGFHSWATNALIIACIGWLPIILGGERFNSTVISGNLPQITRNLMTLAMSGLLFSAIVSTLLLPHRPGSVGAIKKIGTRILAVVEWFFLPIGIIIFGAIPALEAQTRLMLGKYMGFLVTPKERK
jgi:hypothetical protein